MTESEKIYNELRKKHQLPDYSYMEQELEISDIESRQLLKHITIKIGEKLEFLTHMLEDVLQPEAVHSMHESKHLSDLQRKQIYELYKKMMSMNRRIVELSLLRSDEEDANFIRSFMAEWKNIKPELIGFVSTIKSSWESETEVDEKVRYVG